ncbi:hypothetical protein A5682_21205 [Mycobacterium mantenii]|nr:hypothetical protein A5682_21205 [Mycobacterium mantenii]
MQAALRGHPKIGSQQRLCGGGAQADDDLRSHHLDLGDQPGPARDDLGAARLLVDASLAALAGELEVLDRVGLIDDVRIDAGVLQGAGQQSPRRPDERLAGAVLLVTGLLAHQHQRRAGMPAAEDRLGRILEK